MQLSTASSYEAIIQTFMEWAQAKEDIRYAVIIGSRAHTNRPADEWSDLDVVFATTQPTPYIAESGWLSTFEH